MFSATYSLSDVKAKLIKDYDFYGYSDESDFEDAITSTALDVQYIYFYPKIGSDGYEIIQDKDRTSLTETETFLYWAEVYAICYEFIKERESEEGQLQFNGNESLRVEGYSYTSQVSSTAPNDKTLKSYFDRMMRYFNMAGYNIASLQRTCTIFGDGKEYSDINIIL